MNDVYTLKFLLIAMSKRFHLPSRILLPTDTAHHYRNNCLLMLNSEAVVKGYSVKKLLLKISQN